MMKITKFKYIHPDTKEVYMVIEEEWDEVYDGPWDYKTNEKIIEVILHPKDNFLI